MSVIPEASRSILTHLKLEWRKAVAYDQKVTEGIWRDPVGTMRKEWRYLLLQVELGVLATAVACTALGRDQQQPAIPAGGTENQGGQAAEIVPIDISEGEFRTGTQAEFDSFYDAFLGVNVNVPFVSDIQPVMGDPTYDAIRAVRIDAADLSVDAFMGHKSNGEVHTTLVRWLRNSQTGEMVGYEMEIITGPEGKKLVDPVTDGQGNWTIIGRGEIQNGRWVKQTISLPGARRPFDVLEVGNFLLGLDPGLVDVAAAKSTATPTPPPTETSVPTVNYESVGKLLEGKGDLVADLHFSPALAKRAETRELTLDDVKVIEAVVGGQVSEIGGVYFDWDEQNKAIGYVLVNQATGEQKLVGKFNPNTDNVVELSTGYELNVRYGPRNGNYIEKGSNGEQFYTYGFVYYGDERWLDENGVGRLIPEPVVELIEDFYVKAPPYIKEYQTAFKLNSRGINANWTSDSWKEVEQWSPSPDVPPYLLLPDSGSVDISRERLAQAVAEGRVVVDMDSIDKFRESDAWAYLHKIGWTLYSMKPDLLANTLLAPFQGKWNLTDLEAAIMLEAIYGSGEPITIKIEPVNDWGAYNKPGERQIVVRGMQSISDELAFDPESITPRWVHLAGQMGLNEQEPDWTEWDHRAGRSQVLGSLLEADWWLHRLDSPRPNWKVGELVALVNGLLSNDFRYRQAEGWFQYTDPAGFDN